jgi:hypothetical protein
MSHSPLIRRIAAVVVALAIPLAGAASAQAYSINDGARYGQSSVQANGGFTAYGEYRSTWS